MKYARIYFWLLPLTFSIAFLPSVSNAQKEFEISTHQNISVNTTSSKIRAVINTDNKKSRKIKMRKYCWYDNSSIHETYGGYSGYLLDGEYTEFTYPGNELSASGQFKNGLKNGKWITWNENNSIKEKSSWKNGELNGKRYSYDMNGSLVLVENYKNGKLNGKSVRYTPDSTKISHYKHGNLKPSKESAASATLQSSKVPATKSPAKRQSENNVSSSKKIPNKPNASPKNMKSNPTQNPKTKKGFWHSPLHLHKKAK